MKIGPGAWAERMLSLPEETLSGGARITVHGRREVLVEYHRGILFFDPSVIEVRVQKGAVRILGSELVIRAIDREQILIAGNIGGVEYA